MDLQFFYDYDPILKIFWYVALPSSLIFLIQAVMTFTGTDAFDGVEADFDGNFNGADEPFQLFSFRNLINFLLGFSWTGISLFHSIESKTLLILISTGVGAGFVYMFFIVINQIMKLAEDNSFKISSTFNKTAEVYLTIPANKSGLGKISISINGSWHELNAMTEKEAIERGKVVKIICAEGDNILIVEII